VHWGREGLEATARLIEKAAYCCPPVGVGSTTSDTDGSNYSNTNTNTCSVVLRDELYRLAANEKQAAQLQQTAALLPDLAEWCSPDEAAAQLGLRGNVAQSGSSSSSSSSNGIWGALRLHNGCQVIHVPSYLRGLWRACEREATLSENSTVEWCCTTTTSTSATEIGNESHLSTVLRNMDGGDALDCVVYCAGAGMFERNSKDGATVLTMPLSMQQQQQSTSAAPSSSAAAFPVQLVRGQSLELRVTNNSHPSTTTTTTPPQHALLCGKYVSPLPDPERVLVGATHEFRPEALSRAQVIAELQERTSFFAPPSLWEDAATTVDRVTSGVRVQSQRGWAGRRPIVGRLSEREWIFTGLSSRGLLYHGLYGDILTDAILQDSEASLLDRCDDLLWWRDGD